MNKSLLIAQRQISGKNNLYIKAFFYGFLIFIISFIPILLVSEGRYFVFGDYSVQNIPFWHYVIDCWRNGWPLYDMKSDLGMNFIGSYSYYGLTSPFILLGLLVPKSILIYAMTFINAIIFGTASLGACLYCKRYTKKDSSALICGLLYAFSGAQVFNLVFQFSDSIAIFPFLLLSFDLLVKERKSFVFAVTLMLAGFINYFFLWSDCLFIAIYFFVKLAKKEYRLDIKLFFKIAFEIIIGIGITAFILLPTFFSLMSVRKVGFTIFDTNMLLHDEPTTILRVIQSMILPPDLCRNGSLFSSTALDCNSVAMYIPLFGVIGFICVLLKNKREWYSYLLYACAVFVAIPLLNSTFVMFNINFYARWLFMPLLIMIMMTGKFIDDFENYHIKKPIIICVVLIALMTGYGAYRVFSIKFDGMLRQFIFCIAFALMNLAILYQIRYSDKKSFISKENLVKLVCICCCVSMFSSTFFIAMHNYWEEADKELAKVTNDGNEIVIEDDEFFRTTTWSAYLSNGNMIWNLPSICQYNSVTPNSLSEFWHSLGIDKIAYIELFNDDYPVATFLSCKYDLYYNSLLSGDVFVEPENVPYRAEGYNQKFVNNRYIVYENENFIPMGFTYDYYINKSTIENTGENVISDFTDDVYQAEEGVFDNVSIVRKERKNKEIFEREMLLLKGIWLNDEQIEKYKDILSELPQSLRNDISAQAYVNDCKNRQAQAGYYFEPTKNGFISKINLEKDNLVFYSVAYDNNFTAYVDGKETEIEEVFNGMCAVMVEKGDHTIEFRYNVKGLTEGIVISLTCAALFIGYILAYIVARKRTNTK